MGNSSVGLNLLRGFVLYVDDDDTNLTVFREAMSPPFAVLTASSVAKALEIIGAQQVSVLFADQNMPEVSGIDLLEEVKLKHPEIVRVLVTAFVTTDSLHDAINRGQVWRYVKKPWHNDELREILRAALAESESERLRTAAHRLIASKLGTVGAARDRLEVGISELKALLSEVCSEEIRYQELLERHPWMLGCEYISIHRHARLDDKNIPDFTGMRTRDNCHDIIEIKPPTLRVFSSGGLFLDEFNQAWNQAERYLAFARSESDYLARRKQLEFRNPVCYLIAGFGLSEGQRKILARDKESHNSSIRIITYEELVRLAIRTRQYLIDALASTL